MSARYVTRQIDLTTAGGLLRGGPIELRPDEVWAHAQWVRDGDAPLTSGAAEVVGGLERSAVVSFSAAQMLTAGAPFLREIGEPSGPTGGLGGGVQSVRWLDLKVTTAESGVVMRVTFKIGSHPGNGPGNRQEA